MVNTTIWKSAAARKLIELSGPGTTVEGAIETVVARLLEGLPYPPIDLVALAKRVGVTRVGQEELTGSGELRRKGSSFEIIYSKDLSSGRQRFTIAHEIGHLILVSRGTRCSGSKELEKLCDKLAAEILMPAALFRSFWVEGFSIADLFRTARLFQTSLSATATRAHELFGAGCFEVRQGSIIWSKGIPRSELLELRDSISKTLQEGTTDEAIYLRHRSGGFAPCRLQGMRLAEQHGFFFVTSGSKPQRTGRARFGS